MDNLGKTGEDLVVEHYRSLGFKILERNYIFPHGKQMGELDLVVGRDKELIFVEVKTRRSHSFGDPWEAVDVNKQRKLVKMTKLYLLNHPELEGYDISIDVAAVDVDSKLKPVIILKNAIEDLS